jgi:putative ABC transport system permease protein
VDGFRLIFRALITGPARRHPVRVLLPTIGVAIGVAAVAAIHHANRSVTASFQEAASAVSGRSDFVVTGVSGVPIEDLAALSFLWPIGSFAPAVTGTAVIDDGSHEVAQVLGVDWGGDATVRDIRLLAPAGAAPAGSRLQVSALSEGDTVFVPQPFAARHRLEPGAKLSIVSGGVHRLVRVGGILELSGLARASGGDILVTDVFTAQGLLGKKGVVDRVDIVLDAGVSRPDTARAITAALPPGLSLELPGRAAKTADRMVRAFRFNLNALGSLTLLVGIFLIANAVSIAVLRRRPEIATLRAIGASRSGIFAAFLAEGVAIGVAGTLLGEILGLFVSRAALRAVSGTVSSIYLPTARITGAGYGGAVLLAAVVGISASILATLLPAIEATRVPPAPSARSSSRPSSASPGRWTASRSSASPRSASSCSPSRSRDPCSCASARRCRGACSAASSAHRAGSRRGSSEARSRATASRSRPSRWPSG